MMLSNIHAADEKQQCWVVILAGGAGKRLAREEPKGFVSLAGRPMLAWSLLTFARHPAITDIQIVVPEGYLGEFHRVIWAPLEKELGKSTVKVHMPVVGGRRRQESAQAGLTAALGETADPHGEHTAVLMHDAARPFVSPGVIDDLLSCLTAAHAQKPGVGGVVPALEVADTIKVIKSGRVEADRIVRTIPRERLWQVQTPQAFYLGPLLEAHREAVMADYQATDDAMLFEWMGWPVTAVPGTALSMKITRSEDLSLLDGWLAVRTARARGPRRRTRRVPTTPEGPTGA